MNYKAFCDKIRLQERSRGFHLITDEIISKSPGISKIETGLCHIFIRHTSASLTINENADPTVRTDFLSYFNQLVPENEPYYKHNYEGSDDMPAHLKSALLSIEITIPINKGTLDMGIWQGIYLCEHRNHGGSRSLTVTSTGMSNY